MNNDKLKFVVDSRSFDGSCVTTMSDGIHGDYHHETFGGTEGQGKEPVPHSRVQKYRPQDDTHLLAIPLRPVQ